METIGLTPISGVYTITNLKTGDCYIGESINIVVRWDSHRSRLEKGEHHSHYLQMAWYDYGADQFSWSILEEVVSNKDRLQDAERRWQRKRYQERGNNGYNDRALLSHEEARKERYNAFVAAAIRAMSDIAREIFPSQEITAELLKEVLTQHYPEMAKLVKLRGFEAQNQSNYPSWMTFVKRHCEPHFNNQALSH